MTAAAGRRPISYALVLAVTLAFCLSASVMARADELGDQVRALGAGGLAKIEQAVEALAATGDPQVAPVLEALGEGDLYVRKTDGEVFIATASGGGFRLVDPLTGAEAGEAGKGTLDKIKVNNKLRRVIRSALGALTLLSPNPSVRRDAAEAVFKSRDPAAIEQLDAALEVETVPEIRQVLQQARAAAVLNSDATEEDKITAIAILRERGDREALALLTALVPADGAAQDAVAAAAAEAVEAIEADLALWSGLQNVWYGLSLGSVLLLAAIGLAITFGVMGVINMAHGEMVMIGAYVTFTVQEVIRAWAPELVDYSLLVALPFAFLITGAVGALIERSILRWLYGRPLETLLATWGLSLILQQAVRSVFGPTNREVANPSWMSGAFQLGQLTITYNRLWIFIFSLAVFALLLVVLRRTFFGLQMRAVTQNRAMAASMGIRTPYVDCLTFALGSAIAGVGGVALSQVDNVSPNLGQGYIIDSFMVVVFGGVGNLWGTLVGALTLGIANKFLEPYAGAVLGKILVLVFIILFIQKRPRGLFALKGRTVEA